VRAIGVTPKPQLRRHELDGAGVQPAGSRSVHFGAAGAAVETPLYVRSGLPAGSRLSGPAVIDQLDSTTLVPPGWRAEVDEWLNIRMHREEA
jgi:N-methylhydantoinase A